MKTGELYSWPSVPTGSPTQDRKYSEKKIPESSKRQNLSLPYALSYLHSIHIVSDITSYLEMI